MRRRAEFVIVSVSVCKAIVSRCGEGLVCYSIVDMSAEGCCEWQDFPST